MQEFKFHFDSAPKKKRSKRSILETWVPLSQNAELTAKEKETVLFGDSIDELYLVKPAFLYINAREQVKFVSGEELNYYYTVAKLKKSPYLVLLGEEIKSKNMQTFLQKKQTGETTTIFYLDIYLSPHFGALKPKFHLFEKVSLSGIPNSMVLFKET